MKFFLTLLLISILSNSIFASDKASIIYNSKKHNGQKEMRIKDKNSVSGSIRDLEQISNDFGDEVSEVMMCYDGPTDDVCDLLKIAVEEENNKKNNKGNHELEFKCKADDFGGIKVKIESDCGEKIKISKIQKCV